MPDAARWRWAGKRPPAILVFEIAAIALGAASLLGGLIGLGFEGSGSFGAYGLAALGFRAGLLCLPAFPALLIFSIATKTWTRRSITGLVLSGLGGTLFLSVWLSDVP